MEHTLYITVEVTVVSDLSIEDLIDEFGSETAYNFGDTDNVLVIDEQMLDVSTQNPL